MKTKYLFYSLAVAGMFAACSQEELVETPVLKDNVADRPVAGLVEFSTDDVESRFNYEKANGFEAGDIFGLYLMDEFVDGCISENSDHKAEHWDANTTYWTYQNHWFGMYQFTNSIQSNYPFRYVSEGGKMVWKNDAKLVEGNYFAMFPQNEKALNRRELWHVIDPSVELKKVASSTADNQKYQNVENQFWLGYKQIYRDETASAEGALKVNLKMTGVLAPLKFVINNNSNNTVIFDKISFKSASGKAVPTLAYVRPANENWVKVKSAWNETENCSSVAYGLYDEESTWTRQTVQKIVEWTVPGEERIPYGLEGAGTKKAYIYEFTYPENEVKLEGGVDGGSLLTTYIAIPAMESGEDWENIQVGIYGWMKNSSSSTGWTYGMLTPKKTNDDDNYTFTLPMDASYALWGESEQAEETDYYREVKVEFSEFSWKAVNETVVASTEEMEKMVESYLSKNAGNVSLTIKPDADGVELRQEFIGKLKAASKKPGREIKLTFSGEREGVVIFNEDNTMDVDYTTTETDDKLIVTYSNNVKLVNNAIQNVYGEISVPVENNGTLNIYGKLTGNVVNNQVLNAVGGNIGIVNNYGQANLMCEAGITTLNNKPGAKVLVSKSHGSHSYAAEVATFNNEYEHTCTSCVPAELTVNGGKLIVGNLVNDGKLTNSGTIEIEEKLTNNAHGHGYAMANNEGAKIIGSGILENNGIIDNYGSMAPGTIENKAKINGYSGSISNLENSYDAVGEIYIKSADIDVQTTDNSNGRIIFEGVINQHVGTNGVDDRIYLTGADIKGSGIDDMMTKTGVTHLWLQHNVEVDYNEAGNKSLWTEANRVKVETVVVKEALTIKGDANNRKLTLENAKLVAEKTLSLENALQMKVESFSGSIHVGSGSSLKDKNENDAGNVNHNQMVVATEEELAEAVEKVAEGGTVKLNADLEIKSLVKVTKSMTIDLNGKTIERITENKTADAPAIYAQGETVSLVLKGEGEVRGNMAVWAEGSEVVIEAGNYIGEGNNGEETSPVIYANKNGNITIKGGYFEGAVNSVYMINEADGEGNVEIEGGTYKNYNPANTGQSGEECRIDENKCRVEAYDENGNLLNENTTMKYSDSQAYRNNENVYYKVVAE